MSECPHNDYYYYPSINEEGWKCVGCGELMPGEPAGFRPDLDREYLYLKVGGLMHDLHDAKLIYVSNGSGGEHLTSIVVERCKKENLFDQYSIIQFIMEEMTPSHAAYWKEISEGVLSGNDKRKRCHCGNLANQSTGDRSYCSSICAGQTEFAF